LFLFFLSCFKKVLSSIFSASSKKCIQRSLFRFEKSVGSTFYFFSLQSHKFNENKKKLKGKGKLTKSANLARTRRTPGK